MTHINLCARKSNTFFVWWICAHHDHYRPPPWNKILWNTDKHTMTNKRYVTRRDREWSRTKVLHYLAEFLTKLKGFFKKLLSIALRNSFVRRNLKIIIVLFVLKLIFLCYLLFVLSILICDCSKRRWFSWLRVIVNFRHQMLTTARNLKRCAHASLFNGSNRTEFAWKSIQNNRIFDIRDRSLFIP